MRCRKPWETPGGPGGLQALSFHPIFLCLPLLFFFFCKCPAASSQRYFRLSVPSPRAGGACHIPSVFTYRPPRLEALVSHGLGVYRPWSSLADDGIDVRLRGIKIKSSRQRDLGLSADMFQLPNLVRYPRLEGTDPDLLYRRAVLIQRYCMEGGGRQSGVLLPAGIAAVPSVDMAGSCKSV